MTLTQAEAEKLARELRPGKATIRLGGMSADKLCRLCDHILSGAMKREIENAAYERAQKAVERAVFHVAPDQISGDIVRATDKAIRALITPAKPTQDKP